MESSTILTADVLDIIFEGRNKEYGAYDLRRTYSKRLTLSITVMLSTIGIVTMSFAFTGKKEKTAGPMKIDEVILAAAPEKPERPVEPPPPPPVKPPAPPIQMKSLAFVKPTIVQDDQVKPDEMPPVNETLENVKIGNKNVPDGVDGDLIVAPPGDGQGTVVELPKKEEEDWNKTWTKVEIPSEYPGGMPAWQRFLNRNLHFPPVEDVQGTVVVQFIVDKDGSVSEVEAMSGPDELRAEAVRVIKKSGKWTPAIQNGHQVRSVKKQPIIFRLEE